MFSYFKNSIVNTLDFLKGTTAYFRDVLLMHGFMLFVIRSIAFIDKFVQIGTQRRWD